MTEGSEFIPTPEERKRNRETARLDASPSSEGQPGDPPPRYPGRQNWWFRRSTKAQFGIVIACAVVLFAMIGAIADGGSGNNSVAPPTTTAAVTLDHATPAPEQSAPAEQSAAAETAGQENARRSAESYLETSAFSRTGLIKQLSSEYGEGYSKADAIYAVNHINVDWNEQAAKSAKSYLDTSAFSRQGLIEQLSSEYGDGFTYAQAVYGVNQAGL
jgi:hypothetical protein